MTFAHDEETAGKSDGDEASAETASLPPAQADGAAPGDPPTRGSGPDASRSASSEAQDDAQDTQSMTAAASPEARSDEVDSGIVELIDATPTPVMLPILANTPPDVPASPTLAAPSKRPPPLPSSARPSQTRAVVPPPPPRPAPPLPRTTQTRAVAPPTCSALPVP